MNLCRPSFFADEALEVIVDIAQKLDLLVEDPNSDVRTRPKKPDLAALKKSWLAANERVCAKLAEREGELRHQRAAVFVVASRRDCGDGVEHPGYFIEFIRSATFQADDVLYA